MQKPIYCDAGHWLTTYTFSDAKSIWESDYCTEHRTDK